MTTRKITIHDISRALNIDSSTVSRALNDSPRVSVKTKAKILAKANELGYQRNVLASNLRTKKTNTIGIVVPRISRNFFSNVISGIEETAYEAGYNVIICQSLESRDREKKIMDTLLSNRVDGVLISISMQTTSFDHFEPFIKLGVPIMFYDRPCDFGGFAGVTRDDFNASYRATEHLILNGCKNIVHFGGPQDIELYRNRRDGYESALKKYNIKFDDSKCLISELSANNGVHLAQKVMRMKHVDGIYASNDTSAISAMQFFKSKGVHVPEDIAIVGFNNDPISSVIEPGLSSIKQPDFLMGKEVMDLLVKQINDPEFRVKSVQLKSELIVRGSSVKK